MKIINAENLKKGDVIITPVSSISNRKYHLVCKDPVIGIFTGKYPTVHVWLKPIKDGLVVDRIVEKDFGKMVELDITE